MNCLKVKGLHTVNIKKKLLISLLLLGLMFTFTGALFISSKVVLDTQRYVLYRNYTADEVIKSFGANKAGAQNEFKNSKVAVLGKVSSLAIGNVGFGLGALDDKYQSVIECSSVDLDVLEDFKGLKVGDRVLVYGEVSGGLLGSPTNMRVEAVQKSDEEPKNKDIFSIIDGADIDSANMNTYEIANKVAFKAPATWKAVAHDIEGEELGTIPGYQFKLNEIRGSQTTNPESFFVCYFDNDLLQNAADKSKTNQIEEAIIRNVLKTDEVKGFPLKKVNTYYDTTYQYYQDAYQDKMGNGYHMEFVFEADDTDGVVVYLYVYKTPLHLEEVMATMRFLEIN